MAAAVPLTRTYVDLLLAHAGYSDVDDVLLLLSELVTVAVALAETNVIHIDVIGAGSPTRPRLAAPTEDNESGRGLLLVNALATAWGSYEDPAGRAVWFEMKATSAG